jgi:predicted nucleotidyltransferase
MPHAQQGETVLTEEVWSALRGPSLAVMLYGSRARGVHRPDSDVDVLQLVPSRPSSYTEGRVSVAAYTSAHLMLLARRGSLFVRHLRDEGVVLEDRCEVLAEILAAYRPPADYEALKRDLALALAATSATGAGAFSVGILRLAVYSARTALYVRAVESGHLTFDVERASAACGTPKMAALIRSGRPQDVPMLRSIGLHLLDVAAPAGAPADLPALAVWSRDAYPLASRLLEAVLAGETRIDYTSLTLPPA